MNILRIGFLLLSGVGFGFGVNNLVDTETYTKENESNEYFYQDFAVNYGGLCHRNEEFFDHMLYDLSDTDQAIVQAKIEELLVEYSISLEELSDDYKVRIDLMNDLMIFLLEEEIDISNHGRFFDYDEVDDWHRGMGRR